MKRKSLPSIVWQEGSWFIAKTLGLELASQGKTKKEAVDNLQEALDLLLEDEGAKIPQSFPVKNAELYSVYA